MIHHQHTLFARRAMMRSLGLIVAANLTVPLSSGFGGVVESPKLWRLPRIPYHRVQITINSQDQEKVENQQMRHSELLLRAPIPHNGSIDEVWVRNQRVVLDHKKHTHKQRVEQILQFFQLATSAQPGLRTSTSHCDVESSLPDCRRGG